MTSLSMQMVQSWKSQPKCFSCHPTCIVHVTENVLIRTLNGEWLHVLVGIKVKMFACSYFIWNNFNLVCVSPYHILWVFTCHKRKENEMRWLYVHLQPHSNEQWCETSAWHFSLEHNTTLTNDKHSSAFLTTLAHVPCLSDKIAST